jgi:GGDEF domain-containing protein
VSAEASAGREVTVLASLARLANQSTDLEQALRGGVQLVCAELDCPLAHVFLQQGRSFAPSRIWVARDPAKHQVFMDATMRASFSTVEEVTGRSLDDTLPVYVPKLSEAVAFRRGAALWEAGLDSAVFLPVVSGREVMALLELFWPQLDLTSAHAALLETAVLILGRALDRDALRRERQQRREDLATAAMIDDTTGLYSRRGFFAFAEPHVRIAHRTHASHQLVLAELLSRSAPAQPDLLRATARLLRSVFRETDVLGRLGDREFAAFAVDANAAGGKRILERVQSALATSAPGVQLDLSVVGYDPERPLPLAELLRG